MGLLLTKTLSEPAVNVSLMLIGTSSEPSVNWSLK